MIPLAGSGQPDVTVRLANAPGTVIPGGHFTLFFEVTASSLPDSLLDSVQLPEKWRLLSRRRPERTAGQQHVRYFFVVGTPAVCASGDYNITFQISYGGKQASAHALVSVQAIRKMEVLAVAQPEFIREGDTLRLTYLIRNSGNHSEHFALKTDRGTINTGTDSLTLEPGGTTNVTVSQIIPVTDHNAWQASSNLSLFVQGQDQPVYATASIPVFSSRIRKIDRYFRFPVDIGSGYMMYRYGGRQVTAYQYNAGGRGFLDQKDQHYLDFTVRGPNQFTFPAAGTYDQYSLGYTYRKQFAVSVGDYVLQLNNLMEFGRFGRGVRVEQQFGKVSYMAAYQKARFFPGQRESFSGKFMFKFNESSQLGLHYVSKNVVFHNRRFWSHLAGLGGKIRTREWHLDAELATGFADHKTDYGAFVRLQVSKKWISLTSNLIYTGKHFYGYYNNSRLLNNNLGINITKRLTLGISTNFSDVNPSLDANLFSVSPKDRSYMTFLSYQADKRNRLFAFYSTAARKDRQEPAEFDYSEDFGNLAYHHNSEKFALFYQGRYGYSLNHLAADNSGKKQSFSNLAQPAVRLFPWIWVGGYFEHQHTSKFSAADVTENLFFYGGNARINIKKYLCATFLYRNNYAPDELFVRRSFLDVSLLLDLKRHVFSLSGGRSYIPNMSNTDQNTLFFNATYALRLNIPLARKRNIGSLKGKLTGIGYSKQGNLIQLGSHKFMTDSTGMFSFEGVAPDRYYLSITQNEAGSDGVVPVGKMPMLVDIRSDSIQVIEIPLTRTGGITGKIEFVKASQNGVASVLAEKPVVLAKLTGEAGSYLTELNEKGTFSFREIRPGNWELSLFIPGGQDRFVIEDSARSLTLEADETIDLVFRIRPNERRIHFSERSFEVSVKK